MCSIVVASNDLVLERMLSVTLTINGFSVVTTKNLGEAISIIGNGKINMVLIDQDVELHDLNAFLDTVKGQKIREGSSKVHNQGRLGSPGNIFYPCDPASYFGFKEKTKISRRRTHKD